MRIRLFTYTDAHLHAKAQTNKRNKVKTWTQKARERKKKLEIKQPSMATDSFTHRQPDTETHNLSQNFFHKGNQLIERQRKQNGREFRPSVRAADQNPLSVTASVENARLMSFTRLAITGKQ